MSNTGKILVRTTDNISKEEISLGFVKNFQETYLETAVENILSNFTKNETLKIAKDAYSIVLGVIQAVEDLASKQPTSSADKLKIAIQVVERISKDNTNIISEDLVEEVKLLVGNKLIEGFIESIISVSRGIFKINHNLRNTTAAYCCF
jgi:hypothetical protein